MSVFFENSPCFLGRRVAPIIGKMRVIIIARAIVFDDEGFFYFVRAERDDDFGKSTLIETSGGGVESGEIITDGVLRELREELGIEAEIISKIGVVRVYCNGESVGECDLIIKEDYEANGIMLVIDKLGTYTKSRAFFATIICFVILLVATLVFFKSNHNMRGRRRRYVRK